MTQPRRRQTLALALGEALILPAQGMPRVPLFVGNVPPPDRRPQMQAWLAEQAGLSWDLRLAPWPRAQKLAAAGEGVMFGLTRTALREKERRFSVPIWPLYTWAIVRNGEQGSIRRFGDLDRQVVCWARGSSYGEDFTRAGLGRMDSSEATEDEGALRMVAAGRCRAALISLGTENPEQAVQHPTLAQLGELGLTLVPAVMTTHQLHFVTGNDSRWIWAIERMDRVVSSSRSELERIRQG